MVRENPVRLPSLMIPPVPPISSSARVALDLSLVSRQHFGIISSFVRALVSTFRTHRDLALENLALRRQLAVLRGSVKRSALSNLDCRFWVLLSRIWKEWKRALVLVKRHTGDRGSLAPLRFQTLLELEERSTTTRAATRRSRDPRIDPEDQRGEFSLGGSSRAWLAQTWL